MKLYKYISILLLSLTILSGCNRLFKLEGAPPTRQTEFRVFNANPDIKINYGISGRTKASVAYGKFSDYQVLDGADTVKKINIDNPAGVGVNLVTNVLNFASGKKLYTLLCLPI